MRQTAADELAERLKEFADRLAASGMRPKRVPYGARGPIKSRSPKGFLLDPIPPQLLLADGRLWYYHTRLSPAGIYYGAREDHTRSHHGSIPLDGARFSFLGAVVHKHHFGYRYHEGANGSAEGYELGAIITKGSSPQFVTAAEALADVFGALGAAVK